MLAPNTTARSPICLLIVATSWMGRVRLRAAGIGPRVGCDGSSAPAVPPVTGRM
jgi:hypothetical protein